MLGHSLLEFTHPDDIEKSPRRWIPLRDGVESTEEYEKVVRVFVGKHVEVGSVEFGRGAIVQWAEKESHGRF